MYTVNEKGSNSIYISTLYYSQQFITIPINFLSVSVKKNPQNQNTICKVNFNSFIEFLVS